MTDASPILSQSIDQLSIHQQKAAQEIANRLGAGQQSVTLGGLAGTGKTTLVGHLGEVLGLGAGQIAYCAFTGKASSVINKKYPQAQATTIHGLIYKAIERHCNDCPARFRQDDEKPGAAMRFCHDGNCPECRINFVQKHKLPDSVELIVVDEASMVPEVLYDHLIIYGIPIVWVGDHGQLPPVKSAHNLMEDPDIRLERVHRQVANSPILKLAMQVRNTERPPRAGVLYGEGVSVRKGGSFASNMEEWADGSLCVLVPTNALRSAINKAVRRTMGYPKDTPCGGDRVVCLRNNPDKGIYNGMTGVITQIEADIWGEPAYSALIKLDGEDRVYQGRILSTQFGALETHREVSRREADLWDWGYALTVHKAQGSEYPRVIVRADLAKVSNRTRWLYTAITRATEQLEVIYP